jgi:membrane-associated phospholipid phosphatase
MSFNFIRIFLSLSFFLVFTCIANPQNFGIKDTTGVRSADSLKTSEVTIGHQKSSDNFYKTDSIFSFRSQKGYFPSLFNNIGEQATAPFNFKGKQWLCTAGAIGVTVTLMHFDGDIDEWARVQKQKHNWVKQTSPVLTSLGSNTGIFSVAAFGLFSAAIKNKKGVETSLLATQAMITSGIWVHLIKIFTGRERPEASYKFSKSEGGRWYGPMAQYDQDLAIRKPGSSFDSFPSGHTATAFSIASVFATQYKDIKAVPIISYSLASLVGISRLTEHKHWSSDVFAGALFGYLCGKQVVSHFNKTDKNSIIPVHLTSEIKPEFNIYQNGAQIGLSLTW